MTITSEELVSTVHCPLGDDALFLTSLQGEEGVSKLFEIACRFTSEDDQVDFEQLIGQPMSVEIQMADGEPRFFHGIVSRFSQADATDTNIVYEAELVPWLWLATQRVDCRIFQNKTVVEIIEEVLGAYTPNDQNIDVTDSDPIPYCVQYRESDFAFVSRLMEIHGFGYCFQHEEERHTLFVFDAPEKNAECPGQPKASYESEEGDSVTAGLVLDWQYTQELRSGGYAHTDYNYTDPSLDLSATTTTASVLAGNDALEIYDYPGEYETLQPGQDLATLRMEAQESAVKSIEGRSTCYGFSPGYKFDLQGHYRDSFNATYLILEVEHSLTQEVGAGGSEGASYENTFTCMPHDVPYRPLLLTPKPIIQGAQTAVVVGEAGKEIDIDEYGNVIVQFHWDRLGENDANSSCRVRVSQAWAGKEWGFFAAPRIGQEVIVEFLEGDPDRPIVTGRVYNGDAKVPYELPANKTQSTLKSNSSKGGGGFNEIRFEDKKDSEQIFIHAQKDQDNRVGNDSREFVGNDRHLIVKNDRFEHIENNEHLMVDADQMHEVGGEASLTVASDRKVEIKANDSLDIATDYNVKTGGDTNLKSGGNHNHKIGQKFSVDSGMDIHQKAGMNIGMQGGMNVHIKGGMNVVVEAGIGLTIKAGSSFVTLNPGGVFISGPMVMLNSGGAALAGSGSSPQGPATPVAPDAPAAAVEADSGKPGGVSEVKAKAAKKKKAKPSTTKVGKFEHPQAQTLAAAAESGTPFCEECEAARAAQAGG